jgi:hypothetical protein
MIVVLIGLGLAAVLIMAATRPNTMEMIENDKALCLSMGGEYGHYRCFKDGKEI